MTEIVAEISGNHGGSFDNAIRLIEAAARAGADTVKFQCFLPERQALRRAANPAIKELDAAQFGGEPGPFFVANLLALYRKVYTPREWFPALITRATHCNLNWMSSVFDPDDVAFLETLDCPRYKISAFEMLDWDIIKAVRETGKPIVISVRPMPGVTIMQASNYDGSLPPLGLSAHDKSAFLWRVCPMVEYHLRLEGVDTPDRDFSITEEQLAHIVRQDP